METTLLITTVHADADMPAAIYAVNQWNSVIIANTPPTEDPVLLPLTPASELKTSYETVLNADVSTKHQANITASATASGDEQNVKELWRTATPAGRLEAADVLEANQVDQPEHRNQWHTKENIP